jgi:EmrB/QacA subfamily drug resistance transporter
MFPRGPCDEEILKDAAAPAPCPPDARRWVLAATVLGSSIAFVDSTVVNVALPLIQNQLGASAAQAQWIVEAYALFFSSLLLVGGILGDRLGRRRVFVAGVILFAVASIACGLAPTVGALVASRAVQGVGAAVMVPGSLAILGAAFSSSERGRAIGTWSALTSVATAVGPLLGAWLVQTISWRAAFFVNLPVAAAVAVIASARVPETRDPQAQRPDVAGSVLATLGLGGLIFGLIESADRGWSDRLVLLSIAVGVVALGAFVLEERRSPEPMIPPAFLRERTFVAANLLTLFLYAGLGAALYFLPFDLIQVQGFTPLEAGSSVLPLVILLFALSRWSGALADRIGPRWPLIAGPTIAALGFALLAVPGVGASYAKGFLPGLCAVGLGMAITVAPLTTTVLNSVDARRSGIASGINNAVARVAGLLAVAVLGIAAAAVFHDRLERRVQAAGISAPVREHLRAEASKLGATRAPAGSAPEEARRIEEAVKTSFVASFRVVMAICVGLALAATACAAWGIRKRE